MNTPRKNYDDLQSPYAKHLAQYPSQSEEYLPFELGGPGTGNYGNRQTPQKNARYTSTPAKFDPYRSGGGGRGGGSAHKFTPGGNYQQNRQHQHQHQQHRGRGNNSTRFYGISGAGSRQSSSGGGGGGDSAVVDGEQNYQRQPQRYNTQRGGRGGGGGQQRFHNLNRGGNADGSYFHPSMLEDPWRELMQRHNAIRNSQINLQATQQEKQQEEQKTPEQECKNDSSAESAASEAEQDNNEL